MDAVSTFFLALALPCALTGVALMVAIAAALRARGHEINWIFLRFLILKYIHQYRQVTIQESGRPGPLLYPFIVAMNAALLLTIIGLVLRAV